MSDVIKIDLGGGYFATIDAVDAHLADWGWEAKVCRTNVYAERRRSDGRRQSLHRAVMGEPDDIVDHSDGDGLNCRRGNLRCVTHSVNMRNRAGPSRNNTSGFLGVTERNGKWIARIFHEGRNLHLGVFETAEDANTMRLATEFILWGVEPRRAVAMEPIIAAATEMETEGAS